MDSTVHASNASQLLRVNILEAKGGVCLFEKLWRWSGISRPEGICKLVLTFYQISRDIGEGGGTFSADRPSLCPPFCAEGSIVNALRSRVPDFS